jgi:NADH-quinone oxidoreductase subunit I
MHRSRHWAADTLIGAYSILKGLAVTLRNYFRPRVTENYPAVRTEPAPRLRGRLRHLRQEDGRPRCTACLACQKACPSKALPTIEGDEKRGRERRVKTYVWDAGRCLFCGYCVAACPFDALRMSQVHSVVGESRAELQFGLEALLEPAAPQPPPVAPESEERPGELLEAAGERT